MNDWLKKDVCYSMIFDEQLVVINVVIIDDIKVFYKEYYGVIDGMVLIVGDFDDGVVKKVIVKSFKDWKSFKLYVCLKDYYYELKLSLEVINMLDKVNVFFIVVQNLEIG